MGTGIKISSAWPSADIDAFPSCCLLWGPILLYLLLLCFKNMGGGRSKSEAGIAIALLTKLTRHAWYITHIATPKLCCNPVMGAAIVVILL